MNVLINDNNETVISVGAPGSLARVKAQYPNLIKKLDRCFYESGEIGNSPRVDLAIELIREAGIKSPLETESLLASSMYILTM